MRKGYLSLNGALNLLLHAPGSSLKKMYVSGGRREYFVVPNGGMVEEKHALAIIARPEIGPFEDGLFPGNVSTSTPISAPVITDGDTLDIPEFLRRSPPEVPA